MNKGVKRGVKGTFMLKPDLDGGRGSLNGFIEMEICFPGIGRIYFEGEDEEIHSGHNQGRERNQNSAHTEGASV